MTTPERVQAWRDRHQSVQVWLSPQQYRQLVAAARKAGETLSGYVRRLIDQSAR